MESAADLRQSVLELKRLVRHMHGIEQLLAQGQASPAPGLRDLHSMLKVGEALRDHFRAVLRTNAESWETGHASRP